MQFSMHAINALDMIDQSHVGGTSLSSSACGVVGVTGGIIVFRGFGGPMSSFGGDGISIFGTNRVRGLPQPTRNKKESAIRYFILNSQNIL